MNATSRFRFVSDVDVPSEDLRIRPPFEINRDNQRQFVRLEIQSPLELRKIKDNQGNFWPVEESYPMKGEILNVSAGGLLVDLDQPLGENDIISMRFSLQQMETLEYVLGMVKRVERDECSYLVGIEFISRDRLEDRLSDAELKLVTENHGDFQHCIKDVLNKYLYTESEKDNA